MSEPRAFEECEAIYLEWWAQLASANYSFQKGVMHDDYDGQKSRKLPPDNTMPADWLPWFEHLIERKLVTHRAGKWRLTRAGKAHYAPLVVLEKLKRSKPNA